MSWMLSQRAKIAEICFCSLKIFIQSENHWVPLAWSEQTDCPARVNLEVTSKQKI